jgi:hypothetical protein
MPYIPERWEILGNTGERRESGFPYTLAVAGENIKKGNAIFRDGNAWYNWRGEFVQELAVALQDIDVGESGLIGFRGAVFFWNEQNFHYGYSGLTSLNEDGTNFLFEPQEQGLWLIWKRLTANEFVVVLDGGRYD